MSLDDGFSHPHQILSAHNFGVVFGGKEVDHGVGGSVQNVSPRVSREGFRRPSNSTVDGPGCPDETDRKDRPVRYLNLRAKGNGTGTSSDTRCRISFVSFRATNLVPPSGNIVRQSESCTRTTLIFEDVHTQTPPEVGHSCVCY